MKGYLGPIIRCFEAIKLTATGTSGFRLGYGIEQNRFLGPNTADFGYTKKRKNLQKFEKTLDKKVKQA